jgi:hypothetical protein
VSLDGSGADVEASLPVQSQAELELVEAARRLGPLLSEHSERSGTERRLARPVVEALKKAGFQHLLLPKSLGGSTWTQ